MLTFFQGCFFVLFQPFNSNSFKSHPGSRVLKLKYQFITYQIKRQKVWYEKNGTIVLTSLSTSHISFLLSTNKSEYPTERTLAVRRFPENYEFSIYIGNIYTFLTGTEKVHILFTFFKKLVEMVFLHFWRTFKKFLYATNWL